MAKQKIEVLSWEPNGSWRVRLTWPNEFHPGETCTVEGEFRPQLGKTGLPSSSLLWGYPDDIDECHRLSRRISKAVASARAEMLRVP